MFFKPLSKIYTFCGTIPPLPSELHFPLPQERRFSQKAHYYCRLINAIHFSIFRNLAQNTTTAFSMTYLLPVPRLLFIPSLLCCRASSLCIIHAGVPPYRRAFFLCSRWEVFERCSLFISGFSHRRTLFFQRAGIKRIFISGSHSLDHPWGFLHAQFNLNLVFAFSGTFLSSCYSSF